MKPKNSKARTTSFLKFLALFLVTVTMIVTAVYFNYKVPAKENALLKDQAKLIKSDKEFQSGFFDEMQSIKRMMDSLDGVNSRGFLDQELSSQLVDLKQKIPTKDSTYLYDMHQSIIELYVELHDAKKELHALSDAQETIERYETIIQQCRAELKQAERDLRATN